MEGKIHAYEIWNEPDGGFWKPSPNAAQYVSLLKIAFEEIKKVDPEATVIVGGLCGWNVNFLRDIYLNGGKDYFDAIATHPYGWGPDASPGVAAQFQAFKQLLAENGDQGKEIWITEFGTSTFRSSLLEQQPDVFLRAIDLAMKKIGRKPQSKLKVGVPVELRTPGKIVDAPRKWLPGVEYVKLTPEELAQNETERLAKIGALERQIADLERSCDEFIDISLIGVQVTTAQYGVGIVIEQDVNKIKVRFAEVEKSFILDKKYFSRPCFEDDDEIVSAFTEYGQAQEQIKRLQRELAALQA